MSRGRKVGLAVAALLVAFLLGFAPQWLRVRSMDRDLTELRQENRTLDLGSRLAAALAESQRGNYERARQLMTGFFSGLENERAGLSGAERGELQSLLEERDEIITLLSRAAPESTSRLNLMYSHYFAVTHPLGADAPSPVTPSSPP